MTGHYFFHSLPLYVFTVLTLSLTDSMVDLNKVSYPFAFSTIPNVSLYLSFSSTYGLIFLSRVERFFSFIAMHLSNRNGMK